MSQDTIELEVPLESGQKVRTLYKFEDADVKYELPDFKGELTDRDKYNLLIIGRHEWFHWKFQKMKPDWNTSFETVVPAK